MTTPTLYDIHETSARVRKSVSWLYRNYRRFPHTRIGHSLSWTDEQITAIIHGSAVPAAAPAAPSSQGPSRRKQQQAQTAAKPRGTGLGGFVSRPESSRRLRKAGAA